MNLVRFTPSRELLNVHDEVNRLFDGAFSLLPTVNGSSWMPPVDIHESETGFTLKMDVPGIKPEDLKVRVIDDTLTIEGERRFEQQDDDKGRTHRMERLVGNFSRSFSLRTPVNAAGIRASYRDGVLEVTLPRAEEAMPREIKVEVS
jgi:HSP20 family protein